MKRTFSIAALTDHAKGKKQQCIKRNFFKAKSKPSTGESTESSGETIVSNEQSQKTLKLHFRNADCIKTEILWTLKSVFGGDSVQANNDLNEKLSAMFPDNKIARTFSMARTKAMYAINHLIAPNFNLCCYQV